MATALSTLAGINDLAWARPALDASAAVVAAWYERKAVVLARIAAESGSDRGAWETRAQAAHAHAARLLSGLSGGTGDRS